MNNFTTPTLYYSNPLIVCFCTDNFNSSSLSQLLIYFSLAVVFLRDHIIQLESTFHNNFTIHHWTTFICSTSLYDELSPTRSDDDAVTRSRDSNERVEH